MPNPLHQGGVGAIGRRAALADPKFKGRLTEMGISPVGGSPADFGKLIADETEKWGKVVKFANIRPE